MNTLPGGGVFFLLSFLGFHLYKHVEHYLKDKRI